MMLKHLYKFLTFFAPPILKPLLRHRLRLGKEDEARLPERMGVPSVERPAGRLLWFHAASVGEAISLIPLLQAIRKTSSSCHFLVTTGTVTGAKIVNQYACHIGGSGQTIHQFIPLDAPQWVSRFLKHWKPDLGVFVESELWPNLLLMSKAKGVPMLLVNARMSQRSYLRWKKWPVVANTLLGAFDKCFGQTEKVAQQLQDLGAQDVTCPGNLKFAAAPLPYDQDEFARLKAEIGNRPVWVAASTHPGEESLIAKVHAKLKENFPDLLTILIPRHPSRTAEITDGFARDGLAFCLRHEVVANDTDIYVVNTIGEMGLFYALSPIAFIGGSLVPRGGHNPIEAVLHNSTVLWGPYIHNFEEVCETLSPAALPVSNWEDLADKVKVLLDHPEKANEMSEDASRILGSQTGVLDQLVEQISPYTDARIAA